MVDHFTMRTHGVNQAFRFGEGIWLHRKSRQIRFFLRKKKNEQPSNIKTMMQSLKEKQQSSIILMTSILIGYSDIDTLV